MQEVYGTHPPIREACEQSTMGHASTLEPDIAEAIRKYGIAADWTPTSLALYTQAVLQGAFILAKAREGPEVAAACLDHLRRYFEMLFTPPGTKEKHHDGCERSSMQLTTSPEVLYKVEPQIYRAGVSAAIKPGKLPSGLVYEEFRGGKDFRFILTGSYSILPNACCRIFQVISDGKLPLRDDFNIENYVNDPRTTPEDQLITESCSQARKRQNPTCVR